MKFSSCWLQVHGGLQDAHPCEHGPLRLGKAGAAEAAEAAEAASASESQVLFLVGAGSLHSGAKEASICLRIFLFALLVLKGIDFTIGHICLSSFQGAKKQIEERDPVSGVEAVRA